jgi:hypothetical protein
MSIKKIILLVNKYCFGDLVALQQDNALQSQPEITIFISEVKYELLWLL